VAVGARSSYSKGLHTRLAERMRSEAAVEEVISNSDDKHTRFGGGGGSSDLKEAESATGDVSAYAVGGCQSDLSHWDGK
jgi:hypothetical protein